MATYKEIQGFTNINTSSDPTSDTGQVWYNTTSNEIKSYVLTTEGWASIPTLNAPRTNLAVGGAGDSTAGLAYGGWPSGESNKTEEFNGTSWTTQNTMGTNLYRRGGFGTQTAAVAAGGGMSTDCEEYNGTSWTGINAAPYSGTRIIGWGLETAGGIAGGGTPSGSLSNHGQYDGTNWTSAPSMPGAMNYASGFGVQTAAYVGGAQVGSPTPTGFEWDGTNWTAAGSLPGSAGYNRAGSGIIPAGMYFSEGPGPSGARDLKYNGTAFSAGESMPYNYATGAGSSQTQNNTFAVSGSSGCAFDTGGVRTRTLTTS